MGGRLGQEPFGTLQQGLSHRLVAELLVEVTPHIHGLPHPHRVTQLPGQPLGGSPIAEHPGRIKWGLVLREVLGPVLLPQREYTLVVRGSMVDANGHKLGKDVMKKFRTTAEDRVPINLGDWRVQAPKAGTTQPVTVSFPKSLDHKSLERFLTIMGRDGKSVAGTFTIGKDEKSWSFTPKDVWQNRTYQLDIDANLEDVAGNTPSRPFDLDLKAPKLPPQKLRFDFVPR